MSTVQSYACRIYYNMCSIYKVKITIFIHIEYIYIYPAIYLHVYLYCCIIDNR